MTDEVDGPRVDSSLGVSLSAFRDEDTQQKQDSLTPDAVSEYSRLYRELVKLLWSGAISKAKRGRKTRVDIPDLHYAFDSLVNPSPKRTARNIFLDFFNILAGLSIALGVNYYTSTPQPPFPQWFSPIAAGVLVASIVAVTKYMP